MAKAYRNQGCGTKLIDQLITDIKNSNKANLISLFADNDKVGFYKKFGFMENEEVFFHHVPYMHMTSM